jgi:Cu/Ag efflux protein CusF
MSNKPFAMFALGAGFLAFATVGQAQNKPSSPGNTNAPIDSRAGASKKATGEVTSVDAKAGKLMVKTSSDNLNLEVQGSSAKKDLADIKVGDKVNVSYQDKGGMLIASSVTKASDGAASPARDNSSPRGNGSSTGSSTKDMGSSKNR